MGLFDVLNTPYAILIILLLFSFLPPLIFLIWTRNTERYGREPWHVVIKVFIWGAVFAVLIAAVISTALMFLYSRFVPVYMALGADPTVELLVLALVVAPFVEEATKALGIYTAWYAVSEVEDGIVYGAASGFGFSATENLFYGVAALIAGGPTLSITVIVVRSISSTFLHASATSVTGYGIGRHMVLGGKKKVLPFYLIAVGMHSLFNFFASFGTLYEGSFGEAAYMFSFVTAWIFAIVAFSIIRSRIRKEGEILLRTR